MDLFTVYDRQPIDQRPVDDLPPGYVAAIGLLPARHSNRIIDRQRDTVFEVRSPNGEVVDYALGDGFGNASPYAAREIAWAHYGRAVHALLTAST